MNLTFVGLSIFTIVCCCSVFGAIALAYAIVARILFFEAGINFKIHAMNYSGLSRRWSYWAAGVGSLIIILTIFYKIDKIMVLEETTQSVASALAPRIAYVNYGSRHGSKINYWVVKIMKIEKWKKNVITNKIIMFNIVRLKLDISRINFNVLRIKLHAKW